MARSDVVVRRTALDHAFTDSRGQRWTPAGGAFAGGTTRTVPAPQTDSATPSLYSVVRDGVRRIVLPVSKPGRYAVVVFLADPTRRPGRRTFDIWAQGRRVRSNADVFLLADDPAGRRPLHALFETVVRGSRLTVSFHPRSGAAPVSAIEARRLGPVSMPGIRPLWRDDFNGPAGSPPSPGYWMHDTGARFAHGVLEASTDRTENSSLDGQGHLLIRALREQFTMEGVTRAYTSARLTSVLPVSVDRGQVSVRLRMPATGGTWPTFWLNGDQPPAYPLNGEFDVIEYDPWHPAVLPIFFHFGVGSGDAARDRDLVRIVRRPGFVPSAGMHTYSVDAVPGAAEMRADGRRWSSVVTADLPRGGTWPLSGTLRILLTLDVGGDYVVAPAAQSPFPAVFEIDDVSVSG